MSAEALAKVENTRSVMELKINNINIGTLNKTKVDALREVVKDYDLLKDVSIQTLSVDSGVSGQPMSLNEIVLGAKNRARHSWQECFLSFGIESGFMRVDSSENEYAEICCCATYDGKEYHLGFSCGFEIPPKVMKYILEDNKNLAEAANLSGISDDPDLGKKHGIIGILTNNRITRKDYTKQAIITSLIHFENKDIWE